jgi:sulfite reductase (NADPH) hemoprotein beta-component
LGIEAFASEVETEFKAMQDGLATLTEDELARVSAYFSAPPYRALPATSPDFDAALARRPGLAAWAARSVHPHKVPGYVAVTIPLKSHGRAPGDATSTEMRVVADLAEDFGFGEIRVTHHQNLVLPDVERSLLPALHARLKEAGLATPNIGLLTDIISCPGGDFCALANAVAIPVANAIQQQFDDLDDLFDIGEIELNISGCMNSCGQHHIGHIGILGVDKAGEEWYQISIGGSQGPQTAIGKILGPSFSRDQIPAVIDTLVRTYISQRHGVQERFIDVVRRLGLEPFKRAVYGASA